jgi:hypothetical protein
MGQEKTLRATSRLLNSASRSNDSCREEPNGRRSGISNAERDILECRGTVALQGQPVPRPESAHFHLCFDLNRYMPVTI